MKQINIENVEAGLQHEGFDYYMTDYAAGDMKDTALEPIMRTFLTARKAMWQALVDAGVNMDD